MIIRNTNRFEYYIVQQLVNDVNVPRCHTENLSYENIFIPFKYTLLLFSGFYYFGQKYKGHDFLRAGAFAPVAPPSATRLHCSHNFLETKILRCFKQIFVILFLLLWSLLFASFHAGVSSCLLDSFIMFSYLVILIGSRGRSN